METRRHLVCGTDFSEGAQQALEVAIELAAAEGARIALVHVCEPGLDGEVDDQRLRRCELALARAVDTHRRRRVELIGLLRLGRPWTKLDNAAAEVGARLIVIGRRGAGRAADLGSVAEQLVRCASRSVLTVVPAFDPQSKEKSS